MQSGCCPLRIAMKEGISDRRHFIVAASRRRFGISASMLARVAKNQGWIYEGSTVEVYG